MPAAIPATHDILVIAFCIILCSGQIGTFMELFGNAKLELRQSFLLLGNGIPSRDTGSRLLGMLAPQAFRRWFVGFMPQFSQGCEGVLGVDGKIRRRCYDQAE